MTNTKKKSSKKSKGSRSRSKLPLTYHPDFWEFFRLNKDSILYIARHFAQAYERDIPIIDRDDLIQQALVSLHESGFTKRYKSSKAALSTFLTQRIRNHIRHIAQQNWNRHRLMTEEGFGVKTQFAELNNIPMPPSGNTGPAIDDDIEHRVSVIDLVERLNNSVSDDGRAVLEGVINEKTHSMIAGEVGVTSVYIGSIRSTIKEKAKKLWKK